MLRFQDWLSILLRGSRFSSLVLDLGDFVHAQEDLKVNSLGDIDVSVMLKISGESRKSKHGSTSGPLRHPACNSQPDLPVHRSLQIHSENKTVHIRDERNSLITHQLASAEELIRV